MTGHLLPFLIGRGLQNEILMIQLGWPVFQRSWERDTPRPKEGYNERIVKEMEKYKNNIATMATEMSSEEPCSRGTVQAGWRWDPQEPGEVGRSA